MKLSMTAGFCVGVGLGLTAFLGYLMWDGNREERWSEWPK